MDAYRVRLEVFEGPLDLLLHLIQEEAVDIHDIPIARITWQYLEYLRELDRLDLDRAADFLLMAATLMEIKARLLLPRGPGETAGEDGAEPDPRAELVRRLLEYRLFRRAAELLKERECEAGNSFVRTPTVVAARPALTLEGIGPGDLLSALEELLKEKPPEEPREIERDEFTVRDQMRAIAHALRRAPGRAVSFRALFRRGAGRREIIVTFLALLELMRLGWVIVGQDRTYGSIQIRRKAAQR